MTVLTSNPIRVDQQKIYRVAQALLQVPTPENSQPWKIIIDDNRLKIFHSSERAKLATFPDDLSVMGLGMLLETLELACSQEALAVHTTLFLEDRSDASPWLKAELNPAQTTPDPLSLAIYLRHTDRRKYVGGTLNDPVFQEVHRQAGTNQGANIYFIDRYPDEYLQLLKNADQKVMEWDELRQDLMRWTRFTDKQIAASRDGMSWRSFLRGPENWVYYLRSRVWWAATHFDWYPDWLYRFETTFFDDSSELSPISYDDGAGIGCITTASDDSKDLIAAGRLSLRVWLLFNLTGYGFQPLTNLTSTIYPFHQGRLKIPSHLIPLVASGYETLQQVFGFSNQELPIFCFRVGVAMGKYPNNARALRRDDRHIIYKKS